MRTSLCKLVFVILLIANIGTEAKAQAIKKGYVMVDAYYGFPNFFGLTLRNALLNDPDNADLIAKFSGPMGIKAEYAILDWLGLGVEAYITTVSLQFNDGIVGGYHYKINYSNLRIMPKCVFYYNSNSRGNLNLYGSFGAGYKSATLSLVTNDPFYDEDDIMNASIVPFSMRLVPFGIRYYFTDNFGFGGEIGFGGALLNLGVALKL